jgi:hypothetical protein
MVRWMRGAGAGSAALAAAGVLAVASDARAQGAGHVVAVVVEGPAAEEVTAWVEDRVGAPDRLTEGPGFRNALRARGALPLMMATGNQARNAQLVGRTQAAARDTGVDVAILVDLQKTPRATRVHVWHVDLTHPTPVVDSEITLPPSANAVQESRAILALSPPASRSPAATKEAEPSWPQVRPTVAAASAEAPSAPSAAVDRSPDADRVAAPPADQGPGALLSLQVTAGVGTRHFSYVDRLTPTLRPYDLPAAPLVGVAGAVYPLASSSVPVVRDLGIVGDYSQAIGLGSQDSSGNHVDTSWQSFDVGVTERIRLVRGLQVNVTAGYGGNDFQFDQGLPGGPASLPSVSYRFVRMGADVRYRFWFLPALSVSGGGSYLSVLSSGFSDELFARETVGGIDAHLGASYLLAGHWEASLGASYTRMFYSFNPVPGDPVVAGGALDEQVRVLAGFAYLM